MRAAWIIGNWKMNTDPEEGLELLLHILSYMPDSELVNVGVAPPFTHLGFFRQQLNERHSSLKLGAQNIHHHLSGAFTGEVSLNMIKGFHPDFIIIGHSERRQWNHETNEQLQTKLQFVTSAGLKAIFCLGEPFEVRKAGTFLPYIKDQLVNCLFHLDSDSMEQVLIAYEPVWAIGTGDTARLDQIQEVHSFIRELVAEQYGQKIALKIPILYGGSVNQQNAGEILSLNQVDGALVGGASLKADSFYSIIQAAQYATENLV